MLLLDVVQATRVWFQDGCVMEHLVESDAQKDHVELEERNRQFLRGQGEGKAREAEKNGNKACVFPVTGPFILNQGTL